MSRTSGKSWKYCFDETKNFGEKVVDFLRRLYPGKTAECVSADTGIPIARIDKWLDQVCSPKGADTCRLLAAYGPEFLCAVFADHCPDWLSAAARQEEQRRLRAQIAALEAKLER